MIQTLCDTDEWHAIGVGPVPRQLAVMLLGGLRELFAIMVEDGGRMGDITEVAVQASIALLGPRTYAPAEGTYAPAEGRDRSPGRQAQLRA
jgi:hypothetical protein